MKLKVIGLLAAVFMVTALFGGMVYAAPPAKGAEEAPDYRNAETVMQLFVDLGNAADPQAWIAAQPQEARDAISLANTAVSVTRYVSSNEYASSSASDPICRHHTVTEEKRNNFGWLMLSYKSRTWWCRLNGKIHGDPSFNTTGKVHGVFKATWKYVGDDTSEKTHPDRDWHRDEGTGKFDNCFLGVCVREWEPNIVKVQYGSGQETP